MTASPCDRCGATENLRPVTVLGEYYGRNLWAMWIEHLCPTCAERVRRENRRKEVRRESTT